MKQPKKIKPFSSEDLAFKTTDMDSLATAANRLKDGAWNEKNVGLSEEEKALVKLFKEKLKDYLYIVAQGEICCFCGQSLDFDKSTYTLEHLISKVGKKNVVFHIKNLALSCKPCNSVKYTKKVTVSSLDESADSVFDGSANYRIVHPHFDEWGDHLFIDDYGRVVAKDEKINAKGKVTISTCGIERRNAMRLSDHFRAFRTNVKDYKDWLDFYVTICSEEDLAKKRKYKVFLKNILSQTTDPAALNVKAVIAPLLDGIP